MTDKRTESTWLYHLQDETDAAYLYRILASIETNEKRRDIYLQLADVEDRHIKAWKDLILEHGIKVKNHTPSARARLIAWVSKKFGPGLLRQILLREESNEVKSYLGLYHSSPTGPTRKIAIKLARDSAQHAGKLMDSLGIEDEPWHRTESGGLIRNVVYGFNDGLTANFGLIAGVIGAKASSHIILISGMAGMIADALSMASSGYLAAVSEQEVYEHEKRMEAEEIRLMPELETEELALSYESKGMNKEEAERLAAEVMKDPERALGQKVHEELGIVDRRLSPLKESWITGAATAIGALIPIFPFFFLQGPKAIWTSFIISMLAHFGVGAARSIFTGRGLFRSGLDMFVVGIGVAAVGYFIGELILKFL
ncbi:MAG: hypothetical protein C4291_12130 [Candidatus Dadabacteria bacterium]